jgi:hypothetical protein
VELAQKVENSATTEFYYDGHTIGRRIFKADGTLFVDKSAVVGETKEDASMVDNSTVQVRTNYRFYLLCEYSTEQNNRTASLNQPR